MARDIILHIGTTKTGSTAIQRVLSRRRAALLAQGIAYPRSPGPERHAYLAMAATTDRRRVDNAEKSSWKGASPETRLAKFRQDFSMEMSALPATVKRIVISAEQFSMILLDREGVQNLHDLLAPHADAITVVVYLRRPDQHFTSLYSQMIRWGDAHLPGLNKAVVPAAHGYDYDGLLDRWASVFGEPAVKPRIFERLPGQSFDVVQDFLDLCGVRLGRLPADAATANQAFSLAAQLVLVELAQHLMGDREGTVASRLWLNLVDTAAAALPGQGWKPTRKEAAAFVARYADNHEAVRRRWFAERATLFSTDFSDLPIKPMHLDDAAILQACTRVILALGQKTLKLEDSVAQQLVPQAEQAGDEVQLQNSLARRILLNPDNVEARLKLAQLLSKGGDLAAAHRQLTAILDIDPRHPKAKALRREFSAATHAASARTTTPNDQGGPAPTSAT